MGSITKLALKDGNIRYRARVLKKGFPMKTATLNRYEDAKRWVHQTETGLEQEKYFGKQYPTTKTFKDLADKYISEVIPAKGPHGQAQKVHLNWWALHLGDTMLRDITTPLIYETTNKLGKKPASTVRYLSSLSCLYTFATNVIKWVSESPVSGVPRPKEPRGRVRYLRKEEISMLLTATESSKNPYLHTVVTIALTTGLRLSEIMNLNWSDIDFDRSMMTIHKTKNGSRRSATIHPLASCLLKELSNKKTQYKCGSDLCFPSQKHPWSKAPRKPQSIRWPWSLALKEANITDFRFHDLRHTFASYLAMSGSSPMVISQALGHEGLSQVKRYSHIGESVLEGAIKKSNVLTGLDS